MKNQRTLILAASIFALALSAFPHPAAARGFHGIIIHAVDDSSPTETLIGLAESVLTILVP